MKKWITFVLLGAALLSPKIKAQTDEQKAKRFDSICEVYSKKNQFSGSVLISKKGKVLLNKGYGMANYGYNIANTPVTKFKLASVSKQFTAMAILILEEKGKLSTNDKLSKYIPGYPNGDKITIHNLLTHTSGIQNVTGLPKFDSIKTLKHSHEQIIACFKDLPLEFEPGTKMNYSNSGYILLSYIIEKVSGKTYAQFMKESIFYPLNMKSSGVYDNAEVLKNAAQGYSESDEGYLNAPYIDMSIPSGAGALYSTVEDMFLWDQSFYTEKLVKKSTLQKMLTPFKDNYAYGLKIESFAGHKLITHSGGIEGFATITNRFPEDELYIVILKNVDNQQLFPAHRIARAIMLDQNYELPVERKAASINTGIYKTLIGEYELQPGFVFNITTESGKLFAQATNQPKIEIYPESEYKYFVKVVNAQFEFNKDEKGNITSLTLFQGGATMPAKKIK
jgi:CubicO group peptidase (beta-lactamase class C family)